MAISVLSKAKNISFQYLRELKTNNPKHTLLFDKLHIIILLLLLCVGEIRRPKDGQKTII